MHIDEFLKLFDRVHGCGGGWIARCPAHEDRAASLSIAERDGTILLHCFAGCPAIEVVHALGLELPDLFPPRPDDLKSRREAREALRRAGWEAALKVIDREAMIVEIFAGMVFRHAKVKGSDFTRLRTAMERIADARTTLSKIRWRRYEARA